MTTANEKLDEKFTASFGVKAEVPGPIDTGSTKRPADKENGEATHLKPATKEEMKPTGTTADANRATIKSKLKEDLTVVFGDESLTEEFRAKATVVFEAAVEDRVAIETERLEEEFASKLEEAVAAEVAKLNEQADTYLDAIAEKWLDENRLAVETGIRADVMENFMQGLRSLFVEHYIDIPEDKVDVVESLTARVDELTEKLNDAQNTVIEQSKKIDEATAASIADEIAEGMTATQEDKFKSLIESVEFTSADEYRAKLTTIAEGYVVAKEILPRTSASDQLNEEVQIDAGKPAAVIADPLVAAAMSRIKQSVNR